MKNIDYSKSVPLYLKILENIPTLGIYILGTKILYRLSPIAGILYATYILISTYIFMKKICVYCHSFGTSSCPSGYGLIASKLSKKRSDLDFKTAFKKYIVVVFPTWFVPVFAGIYIFINNYSFGFILEMVFFCLMAFVIIPLFSKFVTCKSCRARNNCPWIKGASSESKKV